METNGDQITSDEDHPSRGDIGLADDILFWDYVSQSHFSNMLVLFDATKGSVRTLLGAE